MVPDSDVDVTIESTPVYLATLRTDGAGNYRGTVTIPASIPLGDHRLVATGTGVSGNAAHRSSAPVVVAAAQAASGGLPRTGQYLLGTGLAGLAALALGAAMRGARRGRRGAYYR